MASLAAIFVAIGFLNHTVCDILPQTKHYLLLTDDGYSGLQLTWNRSAKQKD